MVVAPVDRDHVGVRGDGARGAQPPELRREGGQVQGERSAVVRVGVRHQHGAHAGQWDVSGECGREVEQEDVGDQRRRLLPPLAAGARGGA
jgi:hypothetical protein